jgi:methylated-DNA-protein-cysteine methyltransferase-like protein
MSPDTRYQKIWHTVNLIPKGKVASYGQIADLAGLPGRARLVGKSLGYIHKELQVCWYKVLRSNGQIAFPAGSEQAAHQIGLLQDEGVAVLNNRVNMKTFQWHPNLVEMLTQLEY